MSFTLPNLPYAKDALAPHITAQTLDFHHGKHHQAYVTNLNNLIPGTPFENLSLEDIILQTAGKPEHVGIFNNAAQIWNHTFYWNSMKPNGGGEPPAALKTLMDQAFGSFEDFKTAFKQAATTQFGSGWAWLVMDNGTLSIIKTGNAELPMTQGKKALLTCDVWEHAYYIDFQNRRPDYVDTFLNYLVNWDFALENIGA